MVDFSDLLTFMILNDDFEDDEQDDQEQDDSLDFDEDYA